MPQETSPWNRRELKRERSEPIARWRGSPSYQGGSGFFPRAAEPRRTTGHGKKGGWHLYLEEPGRRYMPSRSFNKTIAMRGDGKHSRSYRDNRGLFAQREYRGGQSWETSRESFSMMPKPPDYGDILKDQHDKRNGANLLSPSQKVEEKRLVDSVDWKPQRWTHSGPQASGLVHSNGSTRASCIDSVERNDKSQSKTIIGLQSSTKKVADYVFLSGQCEGLTSRKKPRLGWGEGLAKYEKKVEGPVGSILGGGMGTNQSVCLDVADRTPGVLGIVDSSCPATSSSLALHYLSNMEDKSLLETMMMSGHFDNLSDLPVSGSQSAPKGSSADMEKLDMSSIASMDPWLLQLLHSNDISLDSGFAVSNLMDKLPFVKDDVLMALLKIESEIELLDNELKSIRSNSGVVCASSIPCSYGVKDHAGCSTGQNDVDSIIPEPAHLQIVSPGDTDVEEMCYVKGTLSDCPVTATFHMVEQDTHLENEDAAQSIVTETVKVVSGSIWDETVEPFEHATFLGDAETLCDVILSSNKEDANGASSEVFNNSLLRNHDKLDVVNIGNQSRCQDDSRTREKFTRRKRFLIFKERVLALKFKAFHHLWQKHLRVLSLRNGRSKPWKKLESSLRIKPSGCQKPRSLICPRVSSPAMMSLILDKQIIDYTSKLVTDSRWRICREDLKMPALCLDKRQKIASRFMSYNGLVEDPCAVEKERTMINHWTTEEREIFLEKFGKYGKDFKRIASFLDHKMSADCVEFYYKNQKSELFQGVKKSVYTWEQPKLISANTYLVTSGKMRNREVNAVSLDLPSEASHVAFRGQAEAGSGELDWGSCYGRSFLHPCSSSSSSRVDSLNDEQEAVAADVLAEIRSSVVPMKSCRGKDLSDWTDVEKSIFMQGVSLYGKDFAMISQYLKTRSKDQCRAFFNKARKCLGLDSMLPRTAGKPLNNDAGAGGDDADGPRFVKKGPVICEDKSAVDENQDLLISDKMESNDAIDCGSSTDPKEAADGSFPMGSWVCEEKGSRISPKIHDYLPEIDLNEQVSEVGLDQDIVY